MEIVIASSPLDCGVSSWDLNTGAELLRHRSCASSTHGLISVAGRFLASSQLRQSSNSNSNSSSGSIFYWSWQKPQVEVKSFPAEPIGPLAVDYEGTYIVGGGQSGEIYLWEVMTGRLLTKWYAHHRAISCLVFSNDGSLVISGSSDGGIRVWSLIRLLDDEWREEESYLYEHNFTQHSQRVTDMVISYGGSNALFVSASEDRTCKVWSLLKGALIRNVVFTSEIHAIAMDPGEHVFYAGGRDGKIYIAALHAESDPRSNYGEHILDILYDQSDKSVPITCLAYSVGNLLVSGSEDGMVRVWDCCTRKLIRVLRRAKGPVNNVVIARLPSTHMIQNSQSSRRQGSALPPPLNRNSNPDQEANFAVVLDLGLNCDTHSDLSYSSSDLLQEQINEMGQQGTAAATDMEIERVKHDHRHSVQLLKQWQRMYENLQQFCVDELLDGDHAGN